MSLKLAFLALVTCNMLTPALSYAANHGAIAYSQSSGARGWSFNLPDRAAAESKALAQCKKHARDCRIAIWFYNNCAALAVASDGRSASAYGATRPDAEEAALRACGKEECSLKVWACNNHKAGDSACSADIKITCSAKCSAAQDDCFSACLEENAASCHDR